MWVSGKALIWRGQEGGRCGKEQHARARPPDSGARGGARGGGPVCAQMHDRKKGCGRGRVPARSLAGRAYHVMASVAAPLTFSPAEKRMSSRAAASAVAGSSRASDNGTAMAAREAPRLPTTALRLPTTPPPDALARVPGRAGARAVRALYATPGAHPPARAPAPLPPAGARRARPHHGSAGRSGNPPRSRGCVLHCVPKKATTKNTETLTNNPIYG